MATLVSSVLAVVVGGLLGFSFAPAAIGQVTGAVAGAAAAGIVAACAWFLFQGKPGMIIGALGGFIVGGWLAAIVNGLILDRAGVVLDPGLQTALSWSVTAALLISGAVFGFVRGRWLTPVNIKSALSASQERKSFKILDTSVIIDGRVADIVETGFLGGVLVVPQFILKELQQIADSSQAQKRNRGRRGLDILQKIKKVANVQVIFPDQDFPDVPEVDLKLIELGRRIGGKIVTNDFNLNKVAQLRGVEVLNINELANALKPVVLPGELMRVFLLKEGKEHGQGIGYLDDGTMVVVDNSRHLIGTTIELVVTSVLQTTAGKMIFGKTDEGKAAHLAMAPQ